MVHSWQMARSSGARMLYLIQLQVRQPSHIWHLSRSSSHVFGRMQQLDVVDSHPDRLLCRQKVVWLGCSHTAEAITAQGRQARLGLSWSRRAALCPFLPLCGACSTSATISARLSMR